MIRDPQMEAFLNTVPDRRIGFDCFECKAQCCHFLSYASKLIIPKESESLIQEKYPEVLNFTVEQKGHQFLTTHKRCWFLKENNCTLHQEHGAQSKPDHCQLYPFTLKNSPLGVPVMAYKPCPTYKASRDKKGHSSDAIKLLVRKYVERYGEDFDDLFLEQTSFSHFRNPDSGALLKMENLIVPILKDLKQEISLKNCLELLEIQSPLLEDLPQDIQNQIAPLIPAALTEDLICALPPEKWGKLTRFFLETLAKSIPLFQDKEGGFSLAWEAAKRELENHVLCEELSLVPAPHIDFPGFHEGPEKTRLLDQRDEKSWPLELGLAKILPHLDQGVTVSKLAEQEGVSLTPSLRNKVRLFVLKQFLEPESLSFS